MLIESLLRRFVVVWAHTQHTVDTTEVTCLELLNDSGGVIAATSHKDGHAALDSGYYEFLDFLLLVLCEAWCLTCCGKDAEEVGTIVELIFHQSHQ